MGFNFQFIFVLLFLFLVWKNSQIVLKWKVIATITTISAQLIVPFGIGSSLCIIIIYLALKYFEINLLEK